jgi:hypothetical protein
MSADPRTLVDGAFNAAIMGSFALPTGGPIVAVGLVTTQVLFSAFFPFPEPVTDPRDIMPTVTDLDTALNQLRDGIAEDLFKAKMADHAALLATLYQQIDAVWVVSAQGDEVIETKAQRGPLFRGEFDGSQQGANWLKRFEQFQQPLTRADSPLLQVMNWIEADPHKIETLPLYMFAGSLWTMYCRFNIAWEYNIILREYDKQLAAHADDMTNPEVNNRLVKWATVGQAAGEPKPAFMPEPKMPTALEDIIGSSQFCALIQDHVPGFIAYAKRIAGAIKSNFESLRTELEKRTNDFTIETSIVDGQTVYNYHDASTRQSSTPNANRKMVEVQMRTKQGAANLAIRQLKTTQFGLDKISEQDVDVILETVSLWEKAVAENAYA